MREGRGYLGLLRRERDFRRVYIAELVSLAGDWFAIVPLLTLLPRLTGTGVWGGAVLAADTAVLALLSPYAGAIADRHDRRRIMVWADIASAVFVLTLLGVRSHETAFLAVAGIGGIAVAKAFYTPAAGGALPNLVDREDFSRASVLSGATWGSMLVVGAALGGVANAIVGPYWCFAFDAVSFLFSAWLTARTKRPFNTPRDRTQQRTVRADFAETVAFARREPRVIALLCCKLGPGLGMGAIALYPLFVRDFYGNVSYGVGVLFGARGLGALVGPLVLRGVVARDERKLPLTLAACMLGTGVGYLLFALSPTLVVAAIVVFAAHIGGGANWILSTYGLQLAAPDEFRGRIISVDFMLVTIALATSQLSASAIAEVAPLRAVAVGLSLVIIGYAVVWWVATSATWRGGAGFAQGSAHGRVSASSSESRST